MSLVLLTGVLHTLRPEHRAAGPRNRLAARGGVVRVPQAAQVRGRVRVHLRIAEKTGKTIRYAAELRKDGEVLANGSLTIICVRRRPGEPARATDILARDRRPPRGGARGRRGSAQHEGLLTRPCSDGHRFSASRGSVPSPPRDFSDGGGSTRREAHGSARVVPCASGLLLIVLPALAGAQQASGIAGSARDTSGAVLPGVTVEAASPALIEKSRTVITDGEGRYNIVDLRPGTYVVTFTLAGFSTVRREGVELTAGFTATVNADMRVGALEETVTVSGASPLVDIQNVQQQKVVSDELLAVSCRPAAKRSRRSSR